MPKISDRDDWFGIWYADKSAMLETMARNLHAEIDRFGSMEEKSVNRWCFYDLLKRGAIA